MESKHASRNDTIHRFHMQFKESTQLISGIQTENNVI